MSPAVRRLRARSGARPLSARPFLPAALHPLSSVALACALAALLAPWPWAAPAGAKSVTQPLPTPQGTTPLPERPGGGQMRLLDPDGTPVAEFPLRHTDVHARISGGIAQVTVEQTFQNPYDRGIEAVYVFPLPHEAAVDDLEIHIGARVVRGDIRKRQEARQIYEQAKRQGRVAALLDEERPNIFTQSIANIQPGHEITVRLRYVETLKYEGRGYALVFPTVVGPRYIPGAPLGPVPAGWGGGGDPGDGHPESLAPGDSGTGWAEDTDRVPDASRITPPVVPPGTRSGHDIMITVDLDAGVPVVDLESVNHAVEIERHGARAASIRLRPSDTIPNKDFVLRYRVAGAGPEFGVLAHRDAGGGGPGYFTLFMQPQAEVGAGQVRPKEMVFVLDTSGSMSGEPIAKAKAAVRWALQHLNPDDTFQVIRFSERASPFAPRPVPNTPENVQRALTYVERLQGEGGTEMLSGIQAALGFEPDPRRLRLVCFLTDGYIGNEAEILAEVRARLGGARLFSFGVGSSVNRYLLDNLAVEGRGAVDYIQLDAETRPLVQRFYERIARPYLTDISVEWRGLQVEDVYPERMPDLFAGQPLSLAGRYRAGGRGEIVIRGKLGNRDFARRLRVDLPERERDNEALGVLWARRRIDSLTRRMLPGGGGGSSERGQDSGSLEREITATALEFRLVTRYTSFVAVDNQVVASDGKPMLVAQPVEMPEGVSYEGVFGPPPGVVVGTHYMMSMSVPSSAVSASRSRSPRAIADGASGKVWSAPPPPADMHVKAGLEKAAPGRAAVASGGPVEAETEARKIEAVALPDSAIQVRVEAARKRLRPGEPVRVRITVRNTGGRPLELPEKLDPGDGSLRLQVLFEGRSLPVPLRLGARAAGSRPLPPGATRIYDVILNGAGNYAFGLAGRYEIEVGEIGGLALPAPRARCTITVR